MGERPSRRDEELKRALEDIDAHIAYPLSGSVAASVRQRLEATQSTPTQPSRVRTRHPVRRGLSLALAACALVVAVLTIVPGPGIALAGWLGLRRVVIVYEPALPTTRPNPMGIRLQLGQRILMPTLTGLSVPDAVYVASPSEGTGVTLVYHAQPGLPRTDQTGVGLLLVELPGGLDRKAGILGKGLEPGTHVEVVRVDGELGYWITGRPHLLFYTDANGVPRMEHIRLAGNVLLWEHGGLTLRVESALPKAQALRIAASVR